MYYLRKYSVLCYKEEASNDWETTEVNALISGAATVIAEDESASQSEGYPAPGSNTNDNEQVILHNIDHSCTCMCASFVCIKLNNTLIMCMSIMKTCTLTVGAHSGR